MRKAVEDRKEFKARLQAAGQWREFLEARKRYTEQGLTDSEANRLARREFGGGDDEPKSRAKKAEVASAAPMYGPELPAPVEVPPAAECGAEEGAAEGDAGPDPKGERGLHDQDVGDVGARVLDDEPAVSSVAAVVRAPVEDRGRGVDERMIIRWVFDNIQVQGLAPDSAPTPGAWAWLQDLNKFADLRADFYKTVWPKLLPTKSALDDAPRRGGSTKLQELIQRVGAARSAAVLSAGPERVPRESSLSV